MNGSLLRGRLLVRIQSGSPKINPFTDPRVKTWENSPILARWRAKGAPRGGGKN